MKFLLVLALILASTNALSKEFLQRAIEKAANAAAICAQENHATPEDLGELMARKFPPSTHEAKCTILCFYQKFDIVTEQGILNKEGLTKILDELKAEDADLHDKVVGITNECVDAAVVHEDPCETVTGVSTCINNKATAMNLERSIIS